MATVPLLSSAYSTDERVGLSCITQKNFDQILSYLEPKELFDLSAVSKIFHNALAVPKSKLFTFYEIYQPYLRGGSSVERSTSFIHLISRDLRVLEAIQNERPFAWAYRSIHNLTAPQRLEEKIIEHLSDERMIRALDTYEQTNEGGVFKKNFPDCIAACFGGACCLSGVLFRRVLDRLLFDAFCPMTGMLIGTITPFIYHRCITAIQSVRDATVERLKEIKIKMEILGLTGRGVILF